MKLTWILIFLCTIGFFYPALTEPALYDTYGFSLNNLIARPYVLVTSIFLHGSLEHLLSNVLILLFFGMAVEDEIGWKRMTTVFFLGAFAGDLLSIFVYPADSIAIGASAGIFALIGIGMLVRPLDLSFYPLIIPIPLALLGLAYALYNAYGFIANIDANISYIAHFGGLFVGLTFGFRREGWRKGIKIILATFLVMVIIPLLWILKG